MTTEKTPQSEDINPFYPPPEPEHPRPVKDEVKGYLRMREAKLMEQLWKKENEIKEKVQEYVHHRTLERCSVNLQSGPTGRSFRKRESISSYACREEAARRSLTLQPPPALSMMSSLLEQGRRAEVELEPKVSLLDELRELNGWSADRLKTFLSNNKLSNYANSPSVEGLTNQSPQPQPLTLT